MLVISRCRHEREVRRIRIPLNIDPAFNPPTDDMIAKRRAVGIGRHLQPDHPRCVDIDDDALKHRDRAVAGERIFPCLQLRVAYFGGDEVHLTDAALVLLEGGNLARVG